MGSPEDEQLIEEVLSGDTEAFGLIVRKYEKAIFNLMYRTTGSTDESADLSQEVFLKAYDKLETYTPRKKKFYSWLYTVALNVARDHLRRQRKNPEQSDNGLEACLDYGVNAFSIGNPERVVEVQSMVVAMSTLSISHREALILRYREGYSIREIAGTLGISVSGAKMRIHRGLEEIRLFFKRIKDEEAQGLFEIRSR
ncbi:MAG: RNA polymerase sigma factor [Desulfobacteraceae bacterium]|nr:RNA polymerase sigma factor [Desulfobacteraceae bacterium]